MTNLRVTMEAICNAASPTTLDPMTLDTSPVDVFRGAAGGMLGATGGGHAPNGTGGKHTKDFSPV